jgi:hypothetical protein
MAEIPTLSFREGREGREGADNMSLRLRLVGVWSWRSKEGERLGETSRAF